MPREPAVKKALSGGDRQRQYRERLKLDPDKYAEYKQKRDARNHQRKKVADMGMCERQTQRKKWTTYSSKRRQHISMCEAEDPHRSCRFCGSQGADMRNVFTSTADCDSAAMTVASVFNLQIEKMDGISEHICSNCWRDLSISLNFQQRIVKANQTLWQIQTQSSAAVTNVDNSWPDVAVKREIQDAMPSREQTPSFDQRDIEESHLLPSDGVKIEMEDLVTWKKLTPAFDQRKLTSGLQEYNLFSYDGVKIETEEFTPSLELSTTSTKRDRTSNDSSQIKFTSVFIKQERDSNDMTLSPVNFVTNVKHYHEPEEEDPLCEVIFPNDTTIRNNDDEPANETLPLLAECLRPNFD